MLNVKTVKMLTFWKVWVELLLAPVFFTWPTLPHILLIRKSYPTKPFGITAAGHLTDQLPFLSLKKQHQNSQEAEVSKNLKATY